MSELRASTTGGAEDVRDRDLRSEGLKELAACVADACSSTFNYWLALLRLWKSNGSNYHSILSKQEIEERVFLYSRALTTILWDRPHYRSSSWQEDLRKNLRNVALPGTGIPLSWVCWSKMSARIFVFLGVPVYSLAAAFFQAPPWRSCSQTLRTYIQHLTKPADWFSIWRVNCALAALHALVTQDPGYDLEDKWEFLEKAEARGIAVTPWFKADKVIVKHRNEEGGLGIHTFHSAHDGGDWVVQELLKNSKDLSSLLPPNAPLSTLRIVTSSADFLSPCRSPGTSSVRTITCVWRAGREKAKTDHSSVMFDIDINMWPGQIQPGASNANWYRLGRQWFGRLQPSNHISQGLRKHPDTGKKLVGSLIPGMKEIRALVETAHAKLVPGIPLVGWDVAITDDGPMLLEANLSCNFFKGSFDRQSYVEFMDEALSQLSRLLPQTPEP